MRSGIRAALDHVPTDEPTSNKPATKLRRIYSDSMRMNGLNLPILAAAVAGAALTACNRDTPARIARTDSAIAQPATGASPAPADVAPSAHTGAGTVGF